MVKKHRVHGLAHRRVAPEGKRQIGHASARERPGQMSLDPAHSLDEVDRIAGMGLDARAHREHVDVEDDVVGRKMHLLRE